MGVRRGNYLKDGALWDELKTTDKTHNALTPESD